jgi:hypothetical protein
MALLRGYQAAKSCTNGPQPGNKALMSWFLGAYGGRGGKNLGIFNCRTVRGGTTTSLHGEGRADDLGINPHGAAWGWEVANALRAHSAELGVQCLIYARKIWSGSYPDAGWRDYTGLADHFDHIHVELTWDAARTLSVPRINEVLGGVRVAVLPPPPPPAPSSPSGRLLVKGMRGADVRALQVRLTTRYPAYCKWAVTDYFGDKTEAGVREFQRRSGLVVDGKVGPATRGALGL